MVASSQHQLTLAGASTVGRGTPWGTLCEVVRKAISPLGYDCAIEPRSWGPDNGRYVSDGRADLGAWHLPHLISAYNGRGNYAAEGPRQNLRVIAHINHPAWVGVAVRKGAVIRDLAEIASLGQPARIRCGGGRVFEIVCEHYGLTAERLETWGGSLKGTHERHWDPVSAPVEEPERVGWVSEGAFDVIIDSVYTGYPPEILHWTQATIDYDLEFLPLPDDLIDKVCAEKMGVRGFVPHRLLRGVWYDVPSVQRLPHAIYCRDDTPDELVTDVARALDEHRHLFRECHLAYSYDPDNVAADFGVPLHPAAIAYYESVNPPT